MANYRLTNKALADLSEIWNYSFDRWSEKQADTYYKMLIESCQLIADNSRLGKAYDDIYDYLLGLKVGQHIIFYRKINTEEIEITRILNSRMDLKNRIQD